MKQVIEFKQNKETGLVEAFKDGKKIDTVHTMAEDVKNDAKKKEKK